MSEEDLNTYKKYVSDLDITKYIVLDSESNYWYSAEYVDKMLKKQDKEIERLNNIIFNQNKRNSHQRIANDNLQNKNKELNNIINELDGYLDLKRKSYIEGFKWSGLEIIDQTKDFLQELKGSDKE